MTLTASRFYQVEGENCDLAAECAFFSSLKMRNGTFKLTGQARFATLDAEIGAVVRERVPDFRQVLDVGASTGVTTVELADFLAELGARPEVVGTDLFVEAHLAEVAPGFRVLMDRDGWPLQYDLAGFALRAWVRRLDYLTLMFAPRLLARAVLHPRLRRMVAESRTIPVRMETRALAARGIDLVENDIFVHTADFVGRFDFIRAANVLNLGYFPVHRIRRALANIRSYCRGPGTLLLVIKSGNSRHDGTLFELASDGQLRIRTRIGRGSEIESLVLESAQKSAANEP